MELFLELLFAVALSLLVSFVIAKLLSVASSDRDVAHGKFVLVSSDATGGVIMCEPGREKQSAVAEFHSRTRFDEDAGTCDEGVEGFRVETAGLPVTGDDSEIDGKERASERVGRVGLEERCAEGSVCERKVNDGGFNFAELMKAGVIVEVGEKLTDEDSQKVGSPEIGVESGKLVEESSETVKFREIGIEFVKDDKQGTDAENDVVSKIVVGQVKDGLCDDHKGNVNDVLDEIEVKDELNVGKSKDLGVLESEDSKGNEIGGVNSNVDYSDNEEEGLLNDWEGIERTDLEKRFGAAMVYVDSKSNADCVSNIDNDVKKQLYGLQKIAIEGPCCEPPPMALKVSARAKWNAWQRLGNMNPEVAMEQYITLLTRSIPGWLEDEANEGDQVLSNARATRYLSSSLHKQPNTEKERKLEEWKLCAKECGRMGAESLESINQDEK